MAIVLMMFVSLTGGALLVCAVSARSAWRLGRKADWLADRPRLRTALLVLLWALAAAAAVGAVLCGGVAAEVFRAMRDIF